MDYNTADNGQIRYTYDNRLRIAQHAVLSASKTGGYLTKADYTYNPDGSIHLMDNGVNDQFDRTYKYDYAGRLTGNVFGAGSGLSSPYQQALTYNGFSEMTSRLGSHWNSPASFSATFVNGRKQPPSPTRIPVYDAAGNLLDSATGTNSERQETAYDEAGRRSTVTTHSRHDYGGGNVSVSNTTLTPVYDGDGHLVGDGTYQIRSTVLGSSLTQLTVGGAKEKTRVFAGGTVIAEQYNPLSNVSWLAADPVSGSYSTILKDGTSYDTDRKEYEPLGQEVIPVEPEYEADPLFPARSADNPEWLCGEAGMDTKSFYEKPIPCKVAAAESDDYEHAMSDRQRFSPEILAALIELKMLKRSIADSFRQQSLRCHSLKKDANLALI